MCFMILYTFILLYLLPALFAAPTTSDIPHTLSSSATAPAPPFSRTNTVQTTTGTLSLHILHSGTITYSHPPRPSVATHTRSLDLQPTPTPVHHIPTPVHRIHQPPVAIIFEVVGGVAGLAFAFSFLRCLYSYKKTPERDRIAALIHRYQLQREMEELQRNPRAVRRSSPRRPAPPPYFPPPPSYVEAQSPLSTSASAAPSIAVPDTSLPSFRTAPAALSNG